MPTANERQHGGTHYKKNAYQHWDFVCDTNQPYLIGCATKYASRWRDKGGAVDLEKMIHYLDKAEERGIKPEFSGAAAVLTRKFCSQLRPTDALMVHRVMEGDWGGARDLARDLIRNEEDDGA